MNNPATEVLLRKRSTPYTFAVTLPFDGRDLAIYQGASAKTAGASYWQAINVLKFTKVRGRVELIVNLQKTFYGSFVTGGGEPPALHVPTGGCLSWMSGSWSGDH